MNKFERTCLAFVCGFTDVAQGMMRIGTLGLIAPFWTTDLIEAHCRWFLKRKYGP